MDVFQQLAELRHAQRKMGDQLGRVLDAVERMERVLGNELGAPLAPHFDARWCDASDCLKSECLDCNPKSDKEVSL